MATDFLYDNTQIVTTGPFKPNGRNVPSDARIRVNTYADIVTIPNPYVGMVITVLADENTDGTMKDYKVKSLKANNLGVADSLVDEVVLYTDYLGVSGGSSNVDLSDYATKEYVDGEIDGLTIPTKTSELTNDSDFVTGSELDEAIATVSTGGSVDLSSYVKKVEFDSALSLKADETDISFNDNTATKTLSGNIKETVIGQEYLGGYIEIQPDSWDGSNHDNDATTRIWGFPHSLLSSEQARIKNEILPGNGYGIMYIRLPLGFAYRGYRNIDETSGLAKNVGPRYKPQDASLKLFFENIAKAGGGLAPEYWCPAPHWVTSGKYEGENQLSAGGSYERTTTLASIKATDSTQYNAQINAFTDAIVDDLEYLHENICPVRIFSLQNEPEYSKQPYGACKYDSQTYNDVLEVLYPKIKASAVLSEYNDEPNEVKLIVASSDETHPFSGIAATYIANHSENIWGYTHHLMRKASGEVAYEGSKRGADWYKTTGFDQYVRMGHENVFCNEYEYFNSFTDDSDNFRCSNNMLHLINELVYGKAKVLHPVIHVLKPIGQTANTTNTKGYCLYAANLKDEYGVEISNATNTNKLAKGTYYPNATMYNSWKLFNDNLPVNSYVVGEYTNVVDNGGYVALKHGGKLYVFMANNGAEDILITLTFDSEKYFDGKYYDTTHVGKPIKEVNGQTIKFLVPAYSGQCWIEQETPVSRFEPVACTRITLTPTSLSFTSNAPQTLNVSLTPFNTTDGVYYSTSPIGIVNVNDGVVTPIANGSTTITATCGSQTATCSVNVNLPSIDSISAVYTQGNKTIYSDTSLDALKSNLVVTASYTDSTTETVTAYTLSGTLAIGTSTITVSYRGKTTTFDVVVSERNTSAAMVTDKLNVYIQAQDGCITSSGTGVAIKNLATNTDITDTTGTLTTDMYSNNVIHFEASNKLIVSGTENKVTVGGSYTLESMLKTNTLIKTATTFATENFEDQNNTGGSCFICRVNNIIEASYRPVSGTTVPLQATLDTSEEWTHIALVVDKTSNQLRFYLNGELAGETAITKYAAASNTVGLNSSTNEQFHSVYDLNMIRQYDKALTSDEITSNYNYQMSLV